MTPGPENSVAHSPVRTIMARAGAVAVPILAGMIVIGGATFARLHYSALQNSRTQLASDGATILALEGVHAFTQAADPQALMTLPVGADSMVMKARVFGAGQLMGTYAVSLKRVGSAGFRLLATGRLVSGPRSMMCTVRGLVRVADDAGEKFSVGYDAAPLCNGTRHRSALTTQLGS